MPRRSGLCVAGTIISDPAHGIGDVAQSRMASCQPHKRDRTVTILEVGRFNTSSPREYYELLRAASGWRYLPMPRLPRSRPQGRAPRRTRRVTRTRARSSGREPDDPEPPLGRLQADEDLAAAIAANVSHCREVAAATGFDFLGDLIDAEVARLRAA